MKASNGIQINPVAASVFKEVCQNAEKLIGKKLNEIYLYGSYARGDYNQWSDIDILITIDCENEEIDNFFDDMSELASELSLKHDITVYITMKSSAHFMRYADVLPYYANVIKEGIKYCAA